MWDTREGRFEGSFVDGMFHGEGCFSYADGSTYEGDWVYGLRHGRAP